MTARYQDGRASVERSGFDGSEFRRRPGGESTAFQRTTERQFARWLQSRGLTGVQEGVMSEQMRDGAVLAELVMGLDPKLVLKGFNRRVLTRAAAITNIELVLGAVWRKGALPAAMPTAEQVYQGKRERIMSLLHVILDVFYLRPMRRKHADFVQWVQRVVAPYNISLSMEALDADITSARGAEVLWRQLADGVVLFCIAHSTWPASLRPAPHTATVFAFPQSRGEARANLGAALACLAQLGVPVFVAPDELGAPPAPAVLLLQAYALHAALAGREGQHAGQDAAALPALRFRDHERLQERHRAALDSPELARFKAFLDRDDSLEAEHSHLVRLRDARLQETARLEALLEEHNLADLEVPGGTTEGALGEAASRSGQDGLLRGAAMAAAAERGSAAGQQDATSEARGGKRSRFKRGKGRGKEP